MEAKEALVNQLSRERSNFARQIEELKGQLEEESKVRHLLFLPRSLPVCEKRKKNSARWVSLNISSYKREESAPEVMGKRTWWTVYVPGSNFITEGSPSVTQIACLVCQI